MLKKEKRNFRRYKHRGQFKLFFNGNLLKAEAVDYSAGGVGIIVNNSNISKGSIVDLNSSEPEINTKGRIIWSRKVNGGFRGGIEIIGPLKGSSKHYRLSDILIGLQRTQKTGVLEIKKDPIKKKVFIKDGDMIFSSSNHEPDRLGDILLAEGKITQSQYDHSVRLLKETGKRQGTILVELGYLKPNELVWAVKHQVEKIILSLFDLKDSEFYFKEGSLPLEEVITLKLSTANLIYNGIKGIRDPEYLRSLFPLPDAVLCISPDPLDLFQDIKLDASDRRILSLVDGKSSVEEIIKLSPLGEFETLKTLYVLFSTRLIVDKIEIEPVMEVLEEMVTSGVDQDIGEQTTDIPQNVIDMIEDMYNRHKDMGYYGVLGIKEWAINEEIKKAYYTTAKEFHPDKHFYLPEEMRDKLNTIFAYLTNAYSTLINTQKRKEYDRILSQGTTKQTSNTEIAKERFTEGLAEFRHGNYSIAFQMFGQAVYLDNNTADYHYYYGLALSRLERFKEAERAMGKALKINPLNTAYLTEIGHVYLKLGFPNRAKSNFDKALSIQPANERAKEGLSQLKVM